MLFSFHRGALNAVCGMVALTVILLAVGCGRGATALRENNDPLVRHARDLKTAGQIDGAIRAYNDALDRRGDMPQTHMELAAIYHQDKKDYVRAIYHYQRFLELSPSSAKTNLVAQEIRRARMEFAASLPDRPSDAVQTFAAMVKERELLKGRISDLQAELDRLKGKPAPIPVAATAPHAAPPAVAVTNAAANVSTNAAVAVGETYVVKPGDTLAKIAREYYRDAGMAHAIFEANKSVMKTERDLRAGQKIVLPSKRRNRGG